MPAHCIPFADTGFLPATTQAYIDHNPKLLSLVPHRHELSAADAVLEQRKQFSPEQRSLLVEAFTEQYTFLSDSDAHATLVRDNIASLQSNDTYTVTTGQQLQIFMGPLFFVYKIISLVKLAQALAERYPGKKIVPVFWLAAEDHDIEEINHISLFNETYTWNHEGRGATGRLSCNGLKEYTAELRKRLEKEPAANAVLDVFENIYSSSKNLAEATARIIHHYFGHLGVLVLNADRRELKRSFIPYIKKDIFERQNFPLVNAANKELKRSGFDYQLNPREINFFYLQDNLRERIVFEDTVYKVLNTDLSFTETELEAEINAYPERFSPNAVLRPLYEEVLLPNLAYVAGGSEINYWLELPEMFKANGVTYPVPYLRNSLQLIGNKQYEFLQQQQLDFKTMLSDAAELKQKLTDQFSGQNPLTVLLAERRKNNEEILKALSSLAPEVLKTTKKHLETELTTYKETEAKVSESLYKKSEQLISKILKLKQEAFTVSNLQERRVSALQYLVVYPELWLKLSEDCIDSNSGLYKYLVLN